MLDSVKSVTTYPALPLSMAVFKVIFVKTITSWAYVLLFLVSLTKRDVWSLSKNNYLICFVAE